ncbi:UNVERIFIED_CONTAM: spore germination protein [Brevibacillus sp. OAP136]
MRNGGIPNSLTSTPDMYALSSETSLTSSLPANIELIMGVIGHSGDIVLRELCILHSPCNAALVYIHGIVDTELINDYVLSPLMHGKIEVAEHSEYGVDIDYARLKNIVASSVIGLCEVKDVSLLEECIENILSGKTVLLIDGIEGCMVLGTSGGKSRSIEEPVTESVVRGPREGFVEDIGTNLAIVRKLVKNPNLTVLFYRVGRQTRRELAVVFLKNIANETLVEEVMRRIEQIDIDDAPESGSIEQLIEDNPWSPFPQLQNTERPDKVVSALLEGRVGILLDGTPFTLLAPVTFPMLLEAPEDYYERWLVGSLIRILRYLLVFMGLFLPSLYIALVSYHQGLIPSKLAISITSSREGVPFPTIIEALLMEVTIEILREAGIRLPKPIGQAVGIVGGLVIGQSAVSAGIVSPIMVIVVSVTAISSFALPNYSGGISLRILRFGMMLAASILGLYGIVLAFLLICCHVVRLKSFGVNYAGAFVHTHVSDLKDTFIRFPLFLMKLRPKLLRPKDKRRM